MEVNHLKNLNEELKLQSNTLKNELNEVKIEKFIFNREATKFLILKRESSLKSFGLSLKK